MSFPNEEQRSVIEHGEGAAVVLAPAGTGKTRVMAARLARAIEGGLEPARALCVTFTNRAAAEMRIRVRETAGAAADRVGIRTFHGLCAFVLRREADAVGLARDFRIYDEEDSAELMRALLRGRRDDTVQQLLFDLAAAKSGAAAGDLSLAGAPAVYPRGIDDHARAAIDRYHRALRERDALDFADLVYLVRAAFRERPEVAERWRERFDWVQVDEVQDTHDSEYEIVSLLASRARNLVFFGDVDQTIYGWRGSRPDDVLGRFRREFAPVAEFDIAENHRATKALLRAADRFAATFADRRTRVTPRSDLPEGEPVRVEVAPDAAAEAALVAEICGELTAGPGRADAGRIGILGRIHRRLVAVSRALADAGVPHVTVEAFEFFRRQEVKDALARLRLLRTPRDGGALHRVLLRPPIGVGTATRRRIATEGRACGLRLTDLARLRSHDAGEPFAPLLGALAHGLVVVVDVETTGLDPTKDEIVEIAARRVGGERDGEEFRRLVRPSRPVGDSESIHGYSDDLLAERGSAPEAALAELAAFLGTDAHLVGQNFAFDRAMLAAAAARAGVDLPDADFDDTIDLARRFADLDRYDLATLADAFGVETPPTHHAMDDVRCTAEVLRELEAPLAEGASERERLVAEEGGAFRPLAESLDRWRRRAREVRPAELLAEVLEESGLRGHYAREPRRSAHLDDLVRFLAANDLPDATPEEALSHVLTACSLARNVDHLAPDDDRIPVITVHQAKGLEFDTVILAGCTEDEFPGYFALRAGQEEEERHLFYVALTRARRRLIATAHRRNDWNYPKAPSRFLAPLGDPAPPR